MKLPYDYEEVLYAKDTYLFGSDFDHFVTADQFTSLVSDAGTGCSVSDGAGGRVSLTTAATDNNEVAIRSTTELFLVADDKPLRYVARMQYTEANTDDANVFLGFANAIGANLLVDDGAGVKTTGNFFCFFKVDGGTTWQVRSRNGTETETNDTGVTAGGADFHTFRIEIDNEGTGTNVQVKFFIDDVQCRDASTLRPIVHTIAVASSTEMHAGVYAKAGSANGETIVVDYLYAWQKR